MWWIPFAKQVGQRSGLVMAGLIAGSNSSRRSLLAVSVAMASAAVAGVLTPHAAPERVRTIEVDKSFIRLVPIFAATPIVSAAAIKADTALSGLLSEHRCLAEAMYYEARGEGVQGEKAIAEVIFHRMASGEYGRSICAVVYAGANEAACQFTFVCDGSLAKSKSPEDWRDAELMAAHVLTGQVMLDDETRGAVNYHAVYVKPQWQRDFALTARIGNHIFYRNAHQPIDDASVLLRGSYR